MARWFFPNAKKYQILGDYWFYHFNDTPDHDLENNVRQKIIDHGGKDQDGTLIDTTYEVKIFDDKLTKKCSIFRPDAIPNLTYLDGIITEIKGEADMDKNRRTLLGVYLITKCR